MKIHSLKIEGFRRIENSEIYFGDATYLIGENNVGKSTVLKALELVLQPAQSVSSTDFQQFLECTEGEKHCDEIVLTIEFRNVPDEANMWVGFKGRVLSYTPPEDSQETGNKIIYRKSFVFTSKKEVPEILSYPRTLKTEFENAKSAEDFMEAGATGSFFREVSNPQKALTQAQKKNFEEINEPWSVDTTREEWVKTLVGFHKSLLQNFRDFYLYQLRTKLKSWEKWCFS